MRQTPPADYSDYILGEVMEYAEAVEQSNLVLTAITSGMPLVFFIAANDTREILYANYAATSLFSANSTYSEHVLSLTVRPVMECQLLLGEVTHYYTITTYPILWEDSRATAYLLGDVTAERLAPKKVFAYQDSLTGLDNRLAGLMTLNKWLDLRREFLVCLANLDHIKYINNMYGRGEGDRCIQCVSEHLEKILTDARLCKMRGDEFLILIPGLDQSVAEERMCQIREQVKTALDDRPYYCDISYGIVAVEACNTKNADEVLAQADGKMHESKLESKRKRLLDTDESGREGTH